MKLQNIQLNRTNSLEREKLKKNLTSSNVDNVCLNSEPKCYPSGYYLNFGTRSIKDVYSEYSETEMPTTIKNFIDELELNTSKEKFEKLIAQPRLYQIHQLAFEEMKNCITVDDIKNAFPNEKCLKTIKSLDEVSQSGGGIFNLISAKHHQGIKVFDINEDLSVYIAKQLFFECSSMTDIQKNLAALALDEDIKEKIENSSTWGARTFAPLGIIPPDGKKYGKAVLYSADTKYATALSEALRESWNSLSAEEVTKRIGNLLQGAKKERLTMIDAWNKCIPLRNELSEFLFENLKDSRCSIEQDEAALSFYDGKFIDDIILKKIMIDFWEAHPEGKVELGLEIQKSRKIYEEKFAQGEEVFAAYEKEILDKKAVIKQRLKEERQKARSFDTAKQLVKRIAEQSKQMYIKTPETTEDLYNIILTYMPNRQLRIYEQRLVYGNNIDEFNQVYPPHQQIKNAKNSLEYANMMNAQIFAILTPDLKRGKITEEEFFEALQDKSAFDKLIEKSKTNRTSLELAEYSKMKKLLSQSEKLEVGTILAQYIPHSDKAINGLNDFLDTQGKYLLQIVSDNKLIQNATLLFVLQKIDERCETHSVQNFIEKLQEEKLQQNKLNALEKIDWNSFKTLSWDI